MTIDVTVLHKTSADSVLINVVAESYQSSFSWYCVIDNRYEYELTAKQSDGGFKASKQITVTDGNHTIRVTNGREFLETTFTTIAPTVSFTVTNVQLHSITINVTSDVAVSTFKLSKDGGSTYTEYERPGTSTSLTYTFYDLDINTAYQIKVGAQNPDNDVWGYSGSITVKTQGGIVRLIIDDSWKSAVAYIVVNDTWKQAIVYTVSDGNWRIGT